MLPYHRHFCCGMITACLEKLRTSFDEFVFEIWDMPSSSDSAVFQGHGLDAGILKKICSYYCDFVNRQPRIEQ